MISIYGEILWRKFVRNLVIQIQTMPRLKNINVSNARKRFFLKSIVKIVMKGINEQDFLAWADAYLREELSEEEKRQFEAYCEATPVHAVLFKQHQALVNDMKVADARSNFKRDLQRMGQAYHPTCQPKSSTTVFGLWDTVKVSAAAAAAIAIVSVFSTLWLTGYYKNLRKTTSDYSALRR